MGSRVVGDANPYFPGNFQITNATIVNASQIGDAVGTSDPGALPMGNAGAPADNDTLQINSATQIGTAAQNRRLSVFGPVFFGGPVMFIKGAADTITVDGRTTPHSGVSDFVVQETRAAAAVGEQRAIYSDYSSGGTLAAAEIGTPLRTDITDGAADAAGTFLTGHIFGALTDAGPAFKTAIAIENAARWDNALLVDVDNTVDIGLAAAGGPYATRGRVRDLYLGSRAFVGTGMVLSGLNQTITVDPTAAGIALIDYNLETEFTSGTVFQANYAAGPTVLLAALTGINFDFTTNVTPGAIDVIGVNLNIPATTSAATRAVTITDTQTQGSVVSLDINSVVGAGGLNGILVDGDGVNAAAGTFIGIRVDADGMAGGAAGDDAGILIEVPAGIDALRIGDGRINWIPGAADTFIIAPTATGLVLIDYQLETEFTGGTLVRADYGVGPTVLAAGLTGIDFNFATNVTPGAFDVLGLRVVIPASTGAVTAVLNGESSQTRGNVIYLDINSAVGAAGLNGILVDGDGVNNGANTFRAIQVDLDGATVGAGTLNALSVLMPLAIAGTVQAVVVNETSATMAGGSSALVATRLIRDLTNTAVAARTVTGAFFDIDYDLENNNAGGSLTLTANLIDFDMVMTQTLGTLRWSGDVISLTLAGIIAAGGTGQGILVNADGVTGGAGQTFFGIHVDMDGAAALQATDAGIRIDVPAGINAISIGDGSINWIAGVSDTFIIAPTATGLVLFDFQLETEFTGGTLVRADFGAGPTVLAAALTGINFDFTTNVTPGAIQVNGVVLTIPATTSAAATAISVTDTQTQGSVVSIDINSVVGAGGLNGILVDGDGVNAAAGTFYGVFVNMDGAAGLGADDAGIRIEVPAGINAISIGDGSIDWNMGATDTLDIDAAAVVRTGTTPVININASYDTTVAGDAVVAANIAVTRAALDTGATRGLSVELIVAGAYDAGANFDVTAYRALFDASFNKTAGSGFETVGYYCDMQPAACLEGPAMFFGFFQTLNLTQSITGVTHGMQVTLSHTNAGFSIGEFDGLAVELGPGQAMSGGIRAFLAFSSAGAGGFGGAITGDVYIFRGLFTTAMTGSCTTDWQGITCQVDLSAYTVTGGDFYGVNQILTGGANTARVWGLVADLNGVQPAAGVWRGAYVDLDGVTPNAAGTTVGYDYQAGAMTPAGTINAVRAVMPLASAGTVQAVVVSETSATMAGGSSALTGYRAIRDLTNTGAVVRTVTQPFFDIDYDLENTNAGGSLTASLNLINFLVTQVQTAGTLRVNGQVIALTLDGIADPATGVGGLQIVSSINVAAAAGDFNGIELDLSAMPVGGGSMRGIFIQMPGAYGAGTEFGVRATGDGRTVNVLSDDAAIELGATSTTDAASRSVTDDRGLIGSPDRRFASTYLASPPIIEDFEGGTAVADFTDRWQFGGNLAPTVVASGAGGLIQLATPAVLDQTSILASKGINWGRTVTRAIEWVARAVAAGDITDVSVRVGLTSDPAFGGATDGLVAEFDTTGANPGTWVLVGYSAGARVVGVPGVAIPPVGTADQRIEVRPAADGSGTLFVAGTSRTTVAAAAMGGAACYLVVYVQTKNAVGAAKTWRADTATWRRVPIA